MNLELPLQGDRVRLDAAGGGGLSITRLADEALVGSIGLSHGGRTLTVDSLCIGEPYRGYGCGSEAAYLLIRAAGNAAFAEIRAWAPPDRGLAVYFWYRMGLHPLHGEGPNGGIWLERHLQD